MNEYQKGIIDSLYEQALDKTKQSYIIYNLCTLYLCFSKLVIDVTGFDIQNFDLAVDIYGVKHTLNKHGINARETLRGQIPIVKDDFYRLIEIVKSPDEILKNTFRMDSSGHDAFVVVKKYEFWYYVVFEIRRITGKKKNYQTS